MLWIASDQDRHATGRFLIAFAQVLTGNRFRVRYVFAELGIQRHNPKRAAQDLAGSIADRVKKLGDQDLVLVIRDIEGDTVQNARREADRLESALARRLGIERTRLYTALVSPMTEALYLLDDQMLEKLVTLEERQERGRRDGRRRRGSPGQARRLETFARRKRRGDDPTKKDLSTALAHVLTRKADVAEKMAEVVSEEGYEIPDVGCLRPLRDWLS